MKYRIAVQEPTPLFITGSLAGLEGVIPIFVSARVTAQLFGYASAIELKIRHKADSNVYVVRIEKTYEGLLWPEKYWPTNGKEIPLLGTFQTVTGGFNGTAASRLILLEDPVIAKQVTV